jgi:hypothetical protein
LIDDLREPRRLHQMHPVRRLQPLRLGPPNLMRGGEARDQQGRSRGVMTEVQQMTTRLPMVTRLGNIPGKASAKA